MCRHDKGNHAHRIPRQAMRQKEPA